jgi:hypothetical protein
MKSDVIIGTVLLTLFAAAVLGMVILMTNIVTLNAVRHECNLYGKTDLSGYVFNCKAADAVH